MLIIDKLISLGFNNLSFEEYKVQGFQSCGKYLLSKGIANNREELKKRYTGKGAIAYIPRAKTLTVIEAINTIHNAGGIAIWAHLLGCKWGITLSHSEIEQTVNKFKKIGLDGIEAYYPVHTQSDFEFIHSIAEKKRLLLSGGSDFHSHNYRSDLGQCFRNSSAPYSLLEIMRTHLQKL